MSWVVIKRENKDSVCYGPYSFSEAQTAYEKIVRSEIHDCKTSDTTLYKQEQRFELPGSIGEFTLQMVYLAPFF